MKNFPLVRSAVSSTLFVIVLQAVGMPAVAGCKDAVVLVHGNAGTPADWENTYDLLRDNGYAASEILLPQWGSRYCATCNDITVRKKRRSGMQSTMPLLCRAAAKLT